MTDALGATTGCTTLEVVITGTHKGDSVGVRPLGNAVRIDMAAFYTFEPLSGLFNSAMRR